MAQKNSKKLANQHTAPPDYYYPQVTNPVGIDPPPHRIRKAEYYRDPKNFFGINVQPVEDTFGPHWHPNADEFDYFVKGRGTVGIIGPADKEPVTFDVSEGDAIVIPQGYVHFYINESGSEEPLTFLAVFNNAEFQAIDSAQVPSIGAK